MSTREAEIRAYYLANVNPLFEPLMVDILVARPQDVVGFVIQWMNEKGTKIQGPKETTVAQPVPSPSIENKIKNDPMSSEEDEEDVEELPPPLPKSKQARVSVSAEVYGQFNKKENYVARVIPKSKEQVERIIAKISQSFMFQALDIKDRDTVVNAMEIKEYRQHFFIRLVRPGDWVIQQGEDGDNLYVVDQGQLECTKVFAKAEGPKFLKMYQPGESFGELSLLYNAPRAASIQAKTQSVLFGLDRGTFNNIVKEAAMKQTIFHEQLHRKREKYEDVLSKIEILSSLDKYELTQICDGIREQKFQAGDYIIRQGDTGDIFYMIEEGQLIATKSMEEGQPPVKVFEYKAGDYFGELALLRNVPRQANIVAQTDGAVVYLDSATFKRLLGPIEDILARNTDRYEKYLKQ